MTSYPMPGGEMPHHNDPELEKKPFEQPDNTQEPKEWNDFTEAKKLGESIYQNAKEVSPESNGDLLALSRNYTKQIDDIEARFGTSEPTSKNKDAREKAIREATKVYIDSTRTIVGIREGSEAKLVEDGKDAIRKRDQDGQKWVIDWKESLQKLSKDADEQAQKKRRADREKMQANSALMDQKTAEKLLPKGETPWPDSTLIV